MPSWLKKYKLLITLATHNINGHPMSMPQPNNPIELEKINQETATMKWSELQRFFAAGQAIFIASNLDLICTAQHMAADNKVFLEEAIANNTIHPVTDEQAKEWLANDISTWTVVVKPWLLVQPITSKPD